MPSLRVLRAEGAQALVPVTTEVISLDVGSGSKAAAAAAVHPEDSADDDAGSIAVGSAAARLLQPTPHGTWGRPLVMLSALAFVGAATVLLFSPRRVLFSSSSSPSGRDVVTDGSPGSDQASLDLDLVSAFDHKAFSDSKHRPLHLRAVHDGPWKCLEKDPLKKVVHVKHCSVINPLQQWQYNKEKGLVISHQGSLCLIRVAHNKVRLRECGEHLTEKWVYEGKHLSSPKNECLDWAGGELHTKTCDKASSGEFVSFYRFNEHAYKHSDLTWPSGPRHIRHGKDGFCLEYNKEAVKRAPCNRDAANQHWVYFKSTKQIMTYWHRRCLQAHLTPNHAGHVHLVPCDAEHNGQRFERHLETNHITAIGLCLRSSGPMMGKCKSESDYKEHWSMPRLQGWAEHGGAVNEKFVPPAKIPAERSPLLDKCNAGKPHYPHCGAEKMHKSGIPYKKLQKLAQLIWRRSWPNKVVVFAGDSRGLWFRYGRKYMDRKIRLASEFKVMFGVVVMRLVEKGIVGLDDKVNKWLAWWPMSSADSRSYITLRHCLSMSSGFYGEKRASLDGFNHEVFPLKDADNVNKHQWYELACKKSDAVHCAKAVLHNTPHIAPPGHIWTYTEDHLRIAAAMVVQATGKELGELMEENLFSRTVPPMRRTGRYKHVDYWNPGSNVISSARDYQRFLDSYYQNRLVSEHTAFEMERDQMKHTQVRFFPYAQPTIGRPLNHGLYGLSFWRSHSIRTQCGDWGYCAYAPSAFMSTAVVERMWPYYRGEKKCPWVHSNECSFYFHWQNVDHMPISRAVVKYKTFSRHLEIKLHRLLAVGHEVPGSRATAR